MNLSVKDFSRISAHVFQFLDQAEQACRVRFGEVAFKDFGGLMSVVVRLDEDAVGDGAAAEAVRAIGNAFGLEVTELSGYTSALFASGRGTSLSVQTQVDGVWVRIRAIVDADDTARRAVTDLLKAAAA